ncbi:MAG: VWA domain-containing protein [Polyangiaceae bacterium]
MRPTRSLFPFLFALPLLARCSSNDAQDPAGGAGGTGGLGGIIVTGNPNDRDGGVIFGANACIAEPIKGEPIPVDIYVMFDQSGSMATPVGSGTRLDAVRAAATSFLNASESRGLGVGIGYFGQFPIGSTSCNPADYAIPAVPIGTLPDATKSLLDSLQRVAPTGETPTGAAIRGACGYAQDHRRAHPDHAVFLLLVTDGVPEAPVSMSRGCAPTLDDAVQATTACRSGAPSIKTYVLGVGPSLQNLEQITKAGGTDKTYLVEGGNVSEQVLAALNQIRAGASIQCALQIPAPPPGKLLDFNLVNLLYTNPQGKKTALFNTGDSAGCAASGGWFYDDPGNPQKIVLCDNTCNVVKYEIGGELDYAIGCKTILPPPP